MKILKIVFVLIFFTTGIFSQEKIINLTNSPEFDGKPAWSPDGEYIAYASMREGNMNIWKIPSGGGEPIRITNDKYRNFFPAWSPDGKTIVYQATVNSKTNIWLISSEGGKAEQLTADGGEWPVWSPNGKYILFKKGENENIKYFSIELKNKKERLIYENEKKGLLSRPVWHTDGENILFAVRPIWAHPNRSGNAFDFSNVFQFDTSKKFEKILTRNKVGADRSHVIVSPNGKYFGFIENKFLRIASFIKAPSIDYIRSYELNGLDPAWSPDGKKIAFASPDNYDICILILDF